AGRVRTAGEYRASAATGTRPGDKLGDHESRPSPRHAVIARGWLVKSARRPHFHRGSVPRHQGTQHPNELRRCAGITNGIRICRPTDIAAWKQTTDTANLECPTSLTLLATFQGIV